MVLSSTPLGIRSKFHSEQNQSRHSGLLQWPGIDGIPVRCSSPVNVKEEEKEYAVLVSDFYCKLFDLNVSEDYEYYLWVKDRICNGWFQQVKCEYLFDNSGRYPKIYLEWLQNYYEWPGDLIHTLEMYNNG